MSKSKGKSEKIEVRILPMKKPTLFIVGASKCGTTALHHFLRQHPEIFMPDPKELRFFCKDHIQESDEFYRKNKRYFKQYDYYPCRTEKDYLSFFKDWKDEKIAGEATPGYLNSKVAAQEIYKFNPNAKIIILIRNPVDLLYSLHSHNLRMGVESVKNFRKALTLEVERKKGKYLDKFSLLTRPGVLFYSGRVQFSEQIQRYLNLFGKRRVKIIVFDDFKKDNAKVYREVLKFLGVDQNFVPRFELVNVNKAARFPKLTILLKSSFFTRMYLAPRHVLSPKLFSAYTKLKKFTYKFFFQLHARPPMDPELQKELMKRFKPEVERTSKVVNRDLTGLWGYDAV